MSEAQFEKAKQEDLEDVIDFAEFVFSHNSASTDFMDLLPKLYKPEYFMESIHYLVREGGKIKAVVGAYPLKIDFSEGISIPGRGIGMVSVHPRSRSKGYMKALMNTALEDMKKDGMVFSCLGGLRHRYEYFGFSPAGIMYSFSFDEHNITHTLGKEWKTNLNLKIVNAGDKNILDCIMELHEVKRARYYRCRDRFFDILSSWKSIVFALMEEGRFAGYIISGPDLRDITEINLKDPSRMGEAIGLLLRHRKGMNSNGAIQIIAGPHEREKVTFLSRFAEQWRISRAFQFCIFDFKRFVEPFLKIRAEQRILAEGSFVLKIEGPSGGTYELSSHEGKAEINEISSRQTPCSPDLTLDPLEAIRFLFSPVLAAAYPAIGKSIFLQSLLPLPLFFENTDGI
jgi:predicted N-acetyltransferase YhbS